MQAYECLNSWGDDFGYNGRFYIDYAFTEKCRAKYDAARVSLTSEPD